MRKKTRLHIMAVLHLISFIIVFIANSSATRNTQDYYKKKVKLLITYTFNSEHSYSLSV